jgi:hypothetical protein
MAILTVTARGQVTLRKEVLKHLVNSCSEKSGAFGTWPNGRPMSLLRRGDVLDDLDDFGAYVD